MVSERTRNEVWRELLDAARLTRYYEALADRHRPNHTLTRLFLLATAASGIAALLDVLPDVVRLVAGGLIAFVVAWDFVADYAKKAAILHAISLGCSTLERSGAPCGSTTAPTIPECCARTGNCPEKFWRSPVGPGMSMSGKIEN